MVPRLPHVVLAACVALSPTACGLGSRGLSEATDASQAGSTDDAAASDDEGAMAIADGAVDAAGCSACTGEKDGSVGDGPSGIPAVDASRALDAQQDHTDAQPDTGGPAADAQSNDATSSSCIDGAVACPILALPCCTVVSSLSYGKCTAPAICR